MEDNLIRTFLAVPLPNEVKGKKNMFFSTIDHSNVQINWIKSQNLHLTLKFIGYTPENMFGEIVSELSEIFKNQKPFSISVKDTGCFPFPERPSTLWMGIDGNTNPLKNLVLNIENTMEKLGFPRSYKKFYPHITIARIKYPQKLTPDIQIFLKSHYDPIDLTIDRVQFLASELLKTGTLYSTIKSFPLGESI